jgi:hypothetical protein
LVHCFGRRYSPISRFSSTLSEGNTFWVCGTYPTPRDTSSCAVRFVMGEPFSRIAPERTGISPNIVLISVDLPAPFGPITATTSPSARVRSQPLRMLTSGMYPETTFSATSRGSGAAFSAARTSFSVIRYSSAPGSSYLVPR